MENNSPADHGGGRRGGADLADRIVARTQRVRFLVGFLNQLIEFMGVPANTTCAKFMRIYKLLKIVKIGGQDIDPRFQFVSALFNAALESVKCGLLMYILLANMPGPIVVLCVLMAFAFIAN